MTQRLFIYNEESQDDLYRKFCGDKDLKNEIAEINSNSIKPLISLSEEYNSAFVEKYFQNIDKTKGGVDFTFHICRREILDFLYLNRIRTYSTYHEDKKQEIFQKTKIACEYSINIIARVVDFYKSRKHVPENERKNPNDHMKRNYDNTKTINILPYMEKLASGENKNWGEEFKIYLERAQTIIKSDIWDVNNINLLEIMAINYLFKWFRPEEINYCQEIQNFIAIYNSKEKDNNAKFYEVLENVNEKFDMVESLDLKIPNWQQKINNKIQKCCTLINLKLNSHYAHLRDRNKFNMYFILPTFDGINFSRELKDMFIKAWILYDQMPVSGNTEDLQITILTLNIENPIVISYKEIQIELQKNKSRLIEILTRRILSYTEALYEKFNKEEYVILESSKINSKTSYQDIIISLMFDRIKKSNRSSFKNNLEKFSERLRSVVEEELDTFIDF
jgi:hypothetical protein